MNILIIFHANCSDGFASAYVAHQWRQQEEILGNHHDIEYLACNYGDANLGSLDDKIQNKNVIVLDFSFKRADMERYHVLAKSFEVYDHHKTAKADCEGLPFCFFDMNQSGAMLAWKRFFPDKTPPPFIEYVQDRDLWVWKLPHSKAINAVIQSTEKHFEAYHYLRCAIETSSAIVILKGETILEITAGHIKNAMKYPILMKIGDHKDIPVINNPNLISETCEALAIDKPFAAAFFLRQDGRWQFCLRSRPPVGVDVGEVAKSYGGGGHAAAAGFELPIEKLEQLITDNNQKDNHGL